MLADKAAYESLHVMHCDAPCNDKGLSDAVTVSNDTAGPVFSNEFGNPVYY